MRKDVAARACTCVVSGEVIASINAWRFHCALPFPSCLAAKAFFPIFPRPRQVSRGGVCGSRDERRRMHVTAGGCVRGCPVAGIKYAG